MQIGWEILNPLCLFQLLQKMKPNVLFAIIWNVSKKPRRSCEELKEAFITFCYVIGKSLGTRHKLNVFETFRSRQELLLNVLDTFNSRHVSRSKMWRTCFVLNFLYIEIHCVSLEMFGFREISNIIKKDSHS